MALTVAALFSDFLLKKSAERANSEDGKPSKSRTIQDFPKEKSPKTDERASFCHQLNREITRTCRAIIHHQIKQLKSV